MTIFCKELGTYNVNVNGLRFVVERAREVIRRTGKGRHWARYLVGWLADAAGQFVSKFEMSLGPVLPAELRAYLGHFPDGWAALQAHLDFLAKKLGVPRMLAVCDGLQQINWATP